MPFEAVSGQYYRLVAKHSGLAIGAQGQQQHQGTKFTQVSTDSHPSKELLFHRNGEFYNLLLRDNGQSLDVFGDNNQNNNAVVGRWHRGDGQWNQQFAVYPAGDGTYFLSAHHSSKFLCVRDGGKDVGADLVQADWDRADHFRFSLVPADPIQPRALREPALRGADPLREAALGLVGLLPTVGGGVKFLLGHLWSSGPSLIDQMKDYVVSIAQALVDREFLNTVDKKLATVKKTSQKFQNAAGSPDKGKYLHDIIHDLDGLQQDAFDTTRPAQTMLPYIVTIGTLHLVAQREQIKNYQEYNGTPNTNLAAQVAELKEDIKQYSGQAKTAREKALEWRKSLITSWKEDRRRPNNVTYECFFAKDDYDGWYYGATRTDQNTDQRRAERDAQLTLHTRLVEEQYTAELDALFRPVSAWKYLDPDEKGQPSITPVAVTSQTFGFENGTKFDTGLVASTDKQIIEVSMWFNDAGNQLTGIAIKRRDGTITKAGAERGEIHWTGWNGTDHIVGAFGNTEGALASLYLVSNIGHIHGSGQRGFGSLFRSEPPVPGGTLNSIFGWATADRVQGIGFRWSYPRYT